MGFEPTKRFRRLLELQSSSFDQLGHPSTVIVSLSTDSGNVALCWGCCAFVLGFGGRKPVPPGSCFRPADDVCATRPPPGKMPVVPRYVFSGGRQRDPRGNRELGVLGGRNCTVGGGVRVNGGGGIRTHGTLAGSHAFEARAFDHSATPPRVNLAQSRSRASEAWSVLGV